MGCPLSLLILSIVLETLTAAIRQEIEIKGLRIENEEIKLSLFMCDLINNRTNNSTRKFLKQSTNF